MPSNEVLAIFEGSIYAFRSQVEIRTAELENHDSMSSKGENLTNPLLKGIILTNDKYVYRVCA